MPRIVDTYELSPLQTGLLFHALGGGEPGVDIEQVVATFHEALDEPHFLGAWQQVVERHPILRTRFRWEGLEQPLQDVIDQVELPIQRFDWRGVAETECHRRFQALLEHDRLRGFALDQAPLIRVALVRTAEDEYQMLWTLHHIVLDGRSFPLVLQEVFAVYEARSRGTDTNLAPSRPYRHYIEWLRQLDFDAAENYWRAMLLKFRAPTPLGIARDRRAEHPVGRVRGTREVRLSTTLTTALRDTARELSVSLANLLQGAWALILHRYSGESDVVFGTTRACRRSALGGADDMIGLFINTLPLRIRVDSEVDLASWLQQVRAQQMALHEYEHTPLVKIQGWSDVPRGTPLFESIVMFEDRTLDTQLRALGGRWAGRRFMGVGQTNYPLALIAYGDDELALQLDYSRHRFTDDAIFRMLGHLQILLAGIAGHPRARLKDLPLLTEAERHQLLVEWNDTATDHPGDALLHKLFEAQAVRTPENVAVLFEGTSLTYRELDARSNQLARYLQQRNVGPDTLVAICVERSLEMVVGLLGILKAGGAYMPIDLDYPRQRIAFMLGEAKPPIVLTQDRLRDHLPFDRERTICLDVDWPTISRESPSPVSSRVTSANIAYVIYTSGSTGGPKGVMITHAGISNHIFWSQRVYPQGEADTELQHTSFSFDASVWEIFGPLSSGARLVMARPGGHLDPTYLANAILTHRVSTLQVVPTQLRMLLEEPTFAQCAPPLRHVFCGGEPLTPDLCDLFYSRLPYASLHNLYGPTETSIDATFWICPRDARPAVVPIGRPLDNTRLYIVNSQMQLSPIGVPGELLVGGIGLARGYLERPSLTTERFIPDPFHKDPRARVYKTGDLARYLPDGNIEWLGRIDDQIKIRGFRIELGEIEATLRQHPAVREVIVVAREDIPGDKRLVAYLVVENSPPDLVDQLRAVARAVLPQYMVPAHFMVVDALPLTPSGKIDRTRLPAPGRGHSVQVIYTSPRTRTEKILATIWEEVLGVTCVGIDDDFFELGGHSLLVVRLISRINSLFKASVTVPELFEQPTVGQLAKLIDRKRLTNEHRSQVIQLQKGQTQPFVYFIFARPQEFRLALHMGESRSIFGVQTQWPVEWSKAIVDNRRSAFPTMEQLAAQYVAALGAHARASPCILAGHSFAGLIAFEVAHQLQKQGCQVELVILLDTWARFPTPSNIVWHNVRRYWKQSMSGPSTDRLSRWLCSRARALWLITRWLIAQGKRKTWPFFSRSMLGPRDPAPFDLDEQGIPLNNRILGRLFKRIEYSYRPGRLHTRGVLFRTDPPDHRQAVRAFDGSLGWKNLFSRGLEIVPIAGDHESIMREHSSILAVAINDFLQRQRPSEQENARLNDTAGRLSPIALLTLAAGTVVERAGVETNALGWMLAGM